MHLWPEFAGRVVLVVGGAVGFGYGVARLVAENGGTAWICGRRSEMLDERRRTAEADGLDIRTARADITVNSDVEDMFAEIARSSGRLDGLVCAAGSGVMGTIEEIDLADWDKTVTQMLRGVYLPVRAAIAAMKAEGGSIVLVSSVHGHANIPRRDAVATATSGILGFVRGVAVSMGVRQIRINSVSPGPIDTPTWRTNWQHAFPDLSFEEIAARVGAPIPLGRIGAPDDVAEPIAFLLSSRSRYISGVDLSIDGGLTAKLAMAYQLNSD